MTCPVCGKDIPDVSDECPYCSSDIPRKPIFGNKNIFGITANIKKEHIFKICAYAVAAAVGIAASIAVIHSLTQKTDTVYHDRENLFNSGLAPVYTDNKWGYISNDGKIKINEQYDMAFAFSNALALTYNKSEDSYVFIDTNGNAATKTFTAPNKIGSFSEDGFALVPDGDNSVTYMSADGTRLSSLSFSDGRDFKNGYAAVKAGKKWGFINTDGVIVTDYLYSSVGDYTEDGYAAVMAGGKWGFTDTDGNALTSIKYDEVHDFSYGYAAVKFDGSWHFINTDGDIVFDTNAEEVSDFAENGLCAVESGGLWGYIDTSGKLIIDYKFITAEKFRACGNAVAQTENGFALINKKGELVTEDSYSALSLYDDGYAVFSNDGKLYGIMNTGGNIIADPIYSYISYDRLYRYNNTDRYRKF